jgi:hypothetical protein
MAKPKAKTAATKKTASKKTASKKTASKKTAKAPAKNRVAKAAPAKAPGAAVRFLNPRMPRSSDELDPMQRQQLEHAGKLYDGNRLSAAERLSPDRDHGDGEDEGSFHGMLEIWDVERDGEHRYDAFLYMADSGTVFRRGTLEVVSERIQTYFDAAEEGLAKALQGGYQEAAREHRAALRAGERGGPWSAYRDALDEAD